MALRELLWHVGDGGGRVFRGRFAPEPGAVIAKALEKALDQLFA